MANAITPKPGPFLTPSYGGGPGTIGPGSPGGFPGPGGGPFTYFRPHAIVPYDDEGETFGPGPDPTGPFSPPKPGPGTSKPITHPGPAGPTPPPPATGAGPPPAQALVKALRSGDIDTFLKLLEKTKYKDRLLRYITARRPELMDPLKERLGPIEALPLPGRTLKLRYFTDPAKFTKPKYRELIEQGAELTSFKPRHIRGRAVPYSYHSPYYFNRPRGRAIFGYYKRRPLLYPRGGAVPVVSDDSIGFLQFIAPLAVGYKAYKEGKAASKAAKAQAALAEEQIREIRERRAEIQRLKEQQEKSYFQSITGGFNVGKNWPILAAAGGGVLLLMLALRR